MKKHGLRNVAAALVLAGVITLMVASSAFAVQGEGWGFYRWDNGWSANADASVRIDRVNRTMTLNIISASVMHQPNSYETMGYTPGTFDKGQYVRYNVWIRVDNGGFKPLYSFSNWILVKGITIYPETSLAFGRYIFGSTQLNSRGIVIYGQAGHTYQVLVQVQWSMGGSDTRFANVVPGYSVYAYTWVNGYPSWKWLFPTSAAF